VNQLFYYTRIRRALLPDPDSLASGIYLYRNQSGHIDSRGFETNARFGYGHWKFFAGYTYTAARREAAGQSASLPLVPRHRLGLVLIYEVERAYRAGFEAYYTGSQHRSDGTSTTDFWIFGFMAERRWGRWSAFANLENFTDTRQSRYETMVTGTHRAPQFREIYAPVEGFVMNGGVKVHF
jgi:iron complex outermembrane receptor protein